MLKMPLISFVVTSFNYEKYIEKTIESIKKQSYKNIEIIVVDDCSSDNSVNILEKLDGIKLVKHSENMGQLAAIKTGLKESDGQFVCFVDSDDILHEKYAETLLKVHMSMSVSFVSTQIMEIDENENIHTLNSSSSFRGKNELKNLDELLKINVDEIKYKELNLKNATFGGWWWAPMGSAMFRKSSLDMIQFYDNTQCWKICPDKFLFNYAHLIGGSALVYAPLLAVRRHGENAGFSTVVRGNKRYNNDKAFKLNVENNRKIRPETIKFICANRIEFDKRFGSNNVRKMLVAVCFSYFYILKQICSFLK